MPGFISPPETQGAVTFYSEFCQLGAYAVVNEDGYWQTPNEGSPQPTDVRVGGRTLSTELVTKLGRPSQQNRIHT